MSDNKREAGALQTIEAVLARKIRAKKKELASWRAQRQEAAELEDRCLKEIAEMEMALAVFRRAVGLEVEPPPTDELDLLRLRTQTVAQSSFDIMRRTAGRARVADITRTLILAGKLKKSNSAYAIVTKTLERDERFRRVGRGEFGLVEWTTPES